ncbi:MAG: hypothetical protein UW07_C0014G0016 [Candidatus Nomurabacteria bacterium GW2011_GWF2_43_8]|uniref:Uncharacterized protein n=3 Tax=Candidatus Nomuraibacteriota TaxID=1752729 RepID=A0A0G1FQ20_9BACT|nr:MAG: hypothetical protein UV76_C0004G0019 [Candidatus Nomurabacteria bacterium GW2011_GWA2_43_15]KKT20112.1 MAG: hypothetical protein UW02_C0001G0025 [Candidatus Nomurabacteria bacterium GW2011_GWB1_43_7]KKT24470.1 MAG: hypothetical protein UW07_C0014G0016 [Candidatus Nomurabacteria bacterium GW2011_GWF2_43_8]
MKPETRQCQNCKNKFTIEPDDFSFYEKIKISPPTWCPECRQMRRMSFRNERNLFKKKCDKTGQNIISVFSPNSPFKVYNRAYFDNGEFDPMVFGCEFDFSRPFFEQFKELMLSVPFPALSVSVSENCEYNNDMSRSKDCYLCSRTHDSSNMLYTYRGNHSRDCVDCTQAVKKSEFLYECIECATCSNGSFLYFCENCSSSNFLWNCKNCLDCFMCSNLRNGQYCFKNQKFTKEEYLQKVAEYQLNSFKDLEKTKKEFEEFNKKSIRKYLNITNSQNCTGDNIINSKNAIMCFGAKSVEDVKYLWDVMLYKNSMDCYSGGRNNELIYECTAVAGSYNCHFCVRAPDCYDVSYSMHIHDSKNLFGCISLRNKEYCILNKQYSKEEYEKLKERIIEHMKRTGEYGEFFPMSLSQFEYNATIAQEYFPKTKEEVLREGLRWNDPDTKSYTITVKPEDLPDNVKFVNEDILKETIGCAHASACEHGCSTAFKMIPRELEFYKRMNLALPRLCPNCRHYGRISKLNPLKLWHRKCQCAGTKSENGIYKNLAKHYLHGEEFCPNEFETSYAPDKPEIVYCEKCYQQEVY